MNEDRRKRIEKIIEQLDSLREEEQDAYDNLPESIQDSERGESMTDNVDNLEEAKSTLESILEHQNIVDGKGEVIIMGARIYCYREDCYYNKPDREGNGECHKNSISVNGNLTCMGFLKGEEKSIT